jgi:hypothetical protein
MLSYFVFSYGIGAIATYYLMRQEAIRRNPALLEAAFPVTTSLWETSRVVGRKAMIVKIQEALKDADVEASQEAIERKLFPYFVILIEFCIPIFAWWFLLGFTLFNFFKVK